LGANDKLGSKMELFCTEVVAFVVVVAVVVPVVAGGVSDFSCELVVGLAGVKTKAGWNREVAACCVGGFFTG